MEDRLLYALLIALVTVAGIVSVLLHATRHARLERRRQNEGERQRRLANQARIAAKKKAATPL